MPVGLLAAMPATQTLGAALGFITATLLALQGRYAADFVSYADGSLAAILGCCRRGGDDLAGALGGRGMERTPPAARRLAPARGDPARADAAG